MHKPNPGLMGILKQVDQFWKWTHLLKCEILGRESFTRWITRGASASGRDIESFHCLKVLKVNFFRAKPSFVGSITSQKLGAKSQKQPLRWLYRATNDPFILLVRQVRAVPTRVRGRRYEERLPTNRTHLRRPTLFPWRGMSGPARWWIQVPYPTGHT